MEYNFKTIKEKSYGEFKDRGSKFMAYAFPFEDENNLKEIIAELKKEHIKARHFCFAYKIGLGDNSFRSNDDGEPSGSAGKPILNAILSAELSDVLIVVVRYFGGSLLGVPGLINAYRSSAEEALANAAIFSNFLTEDYQFRFGFDNIESIMRIIKTYNLEIIEQRYEPECVFILRLNKDSEEIIIAELEAFRSFKIEKL